MENKSSFLKDAIESITTLANKAKDPKTLEYNSHLYLIDERGNANRIWEMKDTPEKKRVCSLDALVALIKHEAVDRYATNAHPLFVNCESFGSVTCYLSPDSGNYENRAPCTKQPPPTCRASAIASGAWKKRWSPCALSSSTPTTWTTSSA